jgi:hypothetical protein
LKQPDVLRLLNSPGMPTETADALSKGFDHYGHREALRGSDVVKGAIIRFWELMVELSANVTGAHDEDEKSAAVKKWEMVKRATGQGFVNREGYTQMHLRVSKALRHDFTYEVGLDSAGIDWAEDITAFSGDSKVDIWLEEVKKKFKAATFSTVQSMGWQRLFLKYDEDESGSIDLQEFMAAAREDMHLTEHMMPDAQLKALFQLADEVGFPPLFLRFSREKCRNCPFFRAF